jgi:hypothetical protein
MSRKGQIPVHNQADSKTARLLLSATQSISAIEASAPNDPPARQLRQLASAIEDISNVHTTPGSDLWKAKLAACHSYFRLYHCDASGEVDPGANNPIDRLIWSFLRDTADGVAA